MRSSLEYNSIERRGKQEEDRGYICFGHACFTFMVSCGLVLQIIIKGVGLNEMILEERRALEENALLSKFAPQMLLAPMAVLKAKKAFKRDAMSTDLTIRAQLVN